MNIRFEERVVLITGGAGGIGRAAARGFLEAGAARVVLLDASPAALDDAAGALQRAFPGRVGGEVVDVSDVEATRRVVGRVIAGEGRVDVLFNNAGVNRRKPALEVSVADWDHVLGVNLRGLFFVTQAVGRHMVERGRGTIVNTASVSSVRGHLKLAAYAASKGGIAQVTRVLAHEWAAAGVRVNAVAPGYLETGLTREHLADPAVRAGILARIPAGRIGDADDVVGAVLYLASDWARYVTGEVLFVDGGRTID
jgi:NAD(P)-dependent dehydrogenase (short-subunit alcohol dehydrogenase family)